MVKVEEIHTGVSYNVMGLLPEDMQLLCIALIIYSSRPRTSIDNIMRAKTLFESFNI